MSFKFSSAAAAMGILAMLAGAATAEEEPLTRVFDIRQITSPPAERPGPASLGTSSIHSAEFDDDFGWDMESEFQDEGRDMTEEDLLNAIRDLYPEMEVAEGSQLEVINGRLWATLPSRDMRKLEGILEKFSGLACASIGVRAFFCDAGSLPGDDPTGAVSEERAASLMAAASTSGKWSEELSLCGLNNRRFHAVKGCQAIYLSEYDVEVASGTSIHDPIMNSCETGVLVDARPCLSADGTSCMITVRVSCAFPNGVRPFEVLDTVPGAIQKPDLLLVNFQTTVKVRTGGWVLMSSGGRPGVESGDGGTSGIRLLLKVDRLDPK